jgi:FixJ family two-component response regulator
VIATSSHIAIVDDDESVRESLHSLLASVGYSVVAFPSAEAFLASDSATGVGCLILDMHLPGMTGPALHQELDARHLPIPVVYITAYGEDDTRARALEDGAVDCLLKPFTEDALLRAIRTAVSGA